MADPLRITSAPEPRWLALFRLKRAPGHREHRAVIRASLMGPVGHGSVDRELALLEREGFIEHDDDFVTLTPAGLEKAAERGKGCS